MHFPTHLPVSESVPSAPAPRAGFSLVEVVLALGIVSFALLVMMGMVPVGLSTLRDAMNDSVKTQIVQRIAAEAQLTPFGQIDDYISKTYYFTEEGIQQNSRNGQTLFEVTLQRDDPVYPNSDQVSDLTNSLTAIQIEIARSGTSLPKTHHVIHVANSHGAL